MIAQLLAFVGSLFNLAIDTIYKIGVVMLVMFLSVIAIATPSLSNCLPMSSLPCCIASTRNCSSSSSVIPFPPSPRYVKCLRHRERM